MISVVEIIAKNKGGVIMAWYYGTYSCGCEGRTNVVGPTKNRQWIADKKFEGMCTDCYRRQKEEEKEKANESAEKKAKEMELPELVGTKKQVTWANTIRVKMLDDIEKLIEKHGEPTNEMVTAVEHLQQNINAEWFIDNRNTRVEVILTDIIKELPKINIEKDLSILKPKDQSHDGIVEIKLEDDIIKVKYAKNEDFRLIVKKLGYEWKNNLWQKAISETTGTGDDRMAELGNSLLNEGFCISLIDEYVREKSVSANFEKEHTRWIYKWLKEEGKLSIEHEKNDSLYRKTRRIPTSKYINGVKVDVSRYKEIEDFAYQYNFKFTKSAREEIEKYKTKLENAQTVSVAKKESIKEKEGIEKLGSEGVLEDLLDD